MRATLITAFGLLFSVSAFACPDLSGVYVCGTGSQQYDYIITQQMNGGVTVYNLQGYDVPTDNQTRTVPDTEYARNSVLQARCDDDIYLKMHYVGEYYDNGKHFLNFDLYYSFSLNQGNLLISVAGQFFTLDGQAISINQSSACSRK